MRHDIPPEIRGGWIAMLEDDGVARASFDIRHTFPAEHREFLRAIGFDSDGHGSLHCDGAGGRFFAPW